ncbi:MAG: cobalamin biosynthesis protein CobW [Cyanobacteria bacterium P01_A01_bin.135]
MGKLPVTVITGFLGAGKTTLIRHLLTHSEGRRLAVLVNEFGEIGIDGELLRDCQICDEGSTGEALQPAAVEAEANIVELTNGCLCCTVQEEFLPAMQALLRRRDRLDAVVIETSGLALPQPLVQAFRWPEIRTQATVDSVVTVVDAEAIAAGEVVQDVAALEAQRSADPNLDHETSIDELFADQIACADLVLLTKLDRLEQAQQKAVQQQLVRQLPAGVSVVSCSQGRLAPQVLLGLGVEAEMDLDPRRASHDHEDHEHEHDHDHDHDERITSVQVTFDQPVAPQRLIERLRALGEIYDLYRVKGFVNVPQKPMRLVLQGVGRRFDTFYDRLWHPDEPRQTRLILIGNQLDKADIEAALLPPMSSLSSQSRQSTPPIISI